MSDPHKPWMINVVIYERPRDFPLGYVVRRWDIVSGTPEPQMHQVALTFPTLDVARKYVHETYPQLLDLGRDPHDRAIVAVYM